MVHIVLYRPEIPPNTGNVIRLAAVTGCPLHLVEPLGYSLDDRRLKRAGLDYHDLARVTVHPELASVWAALPDARVLAFTARGEVRHTDLAYADEDVLLFGPESVGLPAEVLDDPRVNARVRLPMLPGRRSLNLSNAVAVAVYEAWRQRDFAPPPGPQGEA